MRVRISAGHGPDGQLSGTTFDAGVVLTANVSGVTVVVGHVDVPRRWMRCLAAKPREGVRGPVGRLTVLKDAAVVDSVMDQEMMLPEASGADAVTWVAPRSLNRRLIA